MPNDALVNRVLSLTNAATPSERLVLKLAAALIKQIDQDYETDEDNDPRIKLSREEFEWLPDRFEIYNGIPQPKDWEIPERIVAAEQEKSEIEALEAQLGDYTNPIEEYMRRCEERRKNKPK